ncbi:MAG: Rid family hydrolase [Minwuia sp.]|uniref:Rid family hydrolase n=1 Tax=Minwuia sp. TaxID=2493630 RepID=UPI003A899C48
MRTTRLNPPDLFDSGPTGFSQVVWRDEGPWRRIHLSGQVAWGPDRKVAGDGGVESQVIASLRNIERALRHAGARLADVMGMRIYIVESRIGEHQAVTRGLKAVFGDAPPASTWVGVPCLASPDFLVEIEPDPVIIPWTPESR